MARESEQEGAARRAECVSSPRAARAVGRGMRAEMRSLYNREGAEVLAAP